MALRVSVSGVRGVIGNGLDAVVAAQWAASFGRWLPAGPVVIGRDSRPSGPMIFQAVSAALMSTGHRVIDIGLATTPTTEMAVQESDAVGGVIITASHNPQPWNALKLLEGQGLFLNAEQNAELVALHGTEGGHVPWDCLGEIETRHGADDLHLDALLALPWLDADAVRAAGLTVAVDCVEGAGGRIVPALLDRLGCRCVPLHCDCTGLFPHPPEPTPAHLAGLGEAVRESGADVGFAVDPDVDRLVLVDGEGTVMSEELTLAVCVDFLLEREPGDVVINLSTTGLVETVAGRHGSTVTRAPVGEANVVAEMLARDAVVGGEGNGGIIYPALHPGRDALVGIAMVLQQMASTGKSLKDIVSGYPPVAMVKDKFDQESPLAADTVRERLAALGEGSFDDSDGVRWQGPDSWVHVRASNTEPIVRVIAEAATEDEARDLIARARDLIQDGS